MYKPDEILAKSVVGLITSKYTNFKSTVNELYCGKGAEFFTPPKEKLFDAYLMPWSKAKVVIVGRSPYTRRRATGLAFESATDIFPPTLSIIRSDLAYSGWRMDSPKLHSWRNQGVLLLNKTPMASQVGEVPEINNMWGTITRDIISFISEETPQGLVFALWGKSAKGLKKHIRNWEGSEKNHMFNNLRHRVLEHTHPASEIKGLAPFSETGQFELINKALEDIGHTPINWGILEDGSEDKTRGESRRDSEVQAPF